MNPRKIAAFFVKECRTELSYRFNFVMRLASAMFFVVMFFFIAKLIAPGSTPYMKPFRGDYFTFVLIGILFHSYLTTGLHSFAQTLRSEQMTGTLESLLATPTPLWTILVGGLLWNFVYDGAHLVIAMGIGVVALHAKLLVSGIPAALLVFMLTLVSYTALGLIAGGFILIFKRGDPVATLVGFLTALLSGVYYPIEVLPGPLRVVASFLPVTYSVRIARDALIRGLPLGAMAHDFAKLALLSAVLLPIGILFFNFALRRARADGSLGLY